MAKKTNKPSDDEQEEKAIPADSSKGKATPSKKVNSSKKPKSSKKKKKKKPVKAKASGESKKKEPKPIIPKPKRRGRPKKRGRKKGSKNTVINNYVQIRSLCWKNKKDYFDSFFDADFLWIVEQVHIECKAQAEQCPDDKILSYFDSIFEQWKNDKRREKPEILEDFLKPRPYWEIDGIAWEVFESYLWIISYKILDSPHEFEMIDYANRKERERKQQEQEKDKERKKSKEKQRGRERQNPYQKHFAKWVNWNNRVAHFYKFDNSEDVVVYFKFSDSEWSEPKQRWECYLIPCTVDGDECSFGYTPDYDCDIDDFKYCEEAEKEEKKKETEQPAKTPTEKPVPAKPKEKIDLEEEKKKLELEGIKKKQQLELEGIKNKQQLELLKDIKKLQLEEIKMWKEVGDAVELKEAITKLKEINKHIEKLLE